MNATGASANDHSQAALKKPEASRSDTSDLIDFTPDASLRGTPALVPTSAGVAPAGKLGGSGNGLEDMSNLKSALPKTAKRDSYASSDDDFVDAH